MKIAFKTISGRTFELVTDETKTFGQIEKELRAAYDIHDPAISFLYNSNIIDENTVFSTIGYKEGSFIVLYLRKLPASKTKTESVPDNKLTNLPELNDKPIEVNSPHIEQNKLHTSPLKIFKKEYNDPPDFKAKIETLRKMGYEVCECESALRSALYQVELAADYLIAGNIPQVPQPLNLEENLLFHNNDEEEESPEKELISDMIKIRDLFNVHPDYFAKYLNKLEETKPDVVKEIRRQPAMFLHNIGLDPAKFDIDSVQTPKSKYEELMNQFSKEEQNAIHRLESNGQDTMMIIQVFIACDKNEELTASCLSTMK